MYHFFHNNDIAYSKCCLNCKATVYYPSYEINSNNLLIVLKIQMMHPLYFVYGYVYLRFLSPFYSKDVRLPVQLQRAMAAEAEAAREARAKVSLFRNLYFDHQKVDPF